MENKEFKLRDYKVVIENVLDSEQLKDEEGLPVFKLRLHHTNGCTYTFFVLEETDYLEGKVKTEEELTKYLKQELENQLDRIYHQNKDTDSAKVYVRHSTGKDTHGVTVSFYRKPINGISTGSFVTLIENDGLYREQNLSQLTKLEELVKMAYEAGKNGEGLDIFTVPDSNLYDL